MTSVISSPLTINPRTVDDGHPSMSNPGLRVALKTMKERCQQLQNRLTMLEDENLQLRIERHSIPGLTKKDPETDSQVSTLYKKIDELSRQRSKLSHHIFMVANENKNLWEELSKLAGDKCVEEKTENEKTFQFSSSKPKRSLLAVHQCQDGSNFSLDEVSLAAPANTSNPGDADWDSPSIKECEYPIMDVDEGEDMFDDIILADMVDILRNFENEKKLLKQQQQGLKAAIDVILRLNKGKSHSKSSSMEDPDGSRTPAKERFEDLNSLCSETDETNRSEGEVIKVSNGFALKNKENNFEDRICPLCTKFYAKSTPFDEFNDHVLSHFVEESEQDSHLSLYEIVA